MRVLPALVSGLVLSVSAAAQVPYWTDVLPPPGNSSFGPTVFGADGDLYQAGGNLNQGTAFGRVRRVDGATGATVWEEQLLSGGNRTSFFRLCLDPSGDVIVGGTEEGSGTDMLAAKFDGATGALLWSTVYSEGLLNDTLSDVAVDETGDVFVVGQRFDGGLADGVTLRLSGSDGAILWEDRFSLSTGRIGASAVELLPAGSGGAAPRVVVAGFRNDTTPPSSTDSYVMVLDAATGTRLWTEVLAVSPTEDRPVDLEVDGDGNSYVLLRADGPSADDEILTVSHDPDGLLRWTHSFSAGPEPYPIREFGQDLVLDDGDAPTLTIVGTSYRPTAPSLGQELVTYRIDAATGGLRWAQVVGTGLPYDDHATGVAVNAQGDVYVSGLFAFDWGGIFAETSAVVLKYAEDGTLDWLQTYDGCGDYDVMHAVAVGPNELIPGFVFGEAVVATGSIWRCDGLFKGVTIKYSP